MRRPRCLAPLLQLLGTAALLQFAVVLADAGPAADHPGGEGGEAASQAERGAAVYEFSCAVCHGASGQGFAEAVTAFPENYRDCSRCHLPHNPAVMPASEVGLSVMVFSLGDPPPLDASRLARFGTAAGLYHYLAAAMPRWAPGSLGETAYLDVTVHLLRAAGLLDPAEPLGIADLPTLRLD